MKSIKTHPRLFVFITSSKIVVRKGSSKSYCTNSRNKLASPKQTKQMIPQHLFNEIVLTTSSIKGDIKSSKLVCGDFVLFRLLLELFRNRNQNPALQKRERENRYLFCKILCCDFLRACNVCSCKDPPHHQNTSQTDCENGEKDDSGHGSNSIGCLFHNSSCKSNTNEKKKSQKF